MSLIITSGKTGAEVFKGIGGDYIKPNADGITGTIAAGTARGASACAARDPPYEDGSNDDIKSPTRLGCFRPAQALSLPKGAI